MKRALAGLAAVALGVGGLLVGTATAAQAAPADAVFVTLIKPDGTAVAAGEVIDEGAPLRLQLQYQKQDAPNDLTGQTVCVDIGGWVTNVVPDVPAGNTAIAGTAPCGVNGLAITFQNTWPGDVNQGILFLDFEVDQVTQSGTQNISWSVDGAPGSLQIVVRNNGDVFENIGSESYDKARTSPSNLNSHVRLDQDADPVYQGVNTSIIGAPINYTLTIEIPDGVSHNDFDIADQLPAGLSYVAGSFNSTLTTWDGDGMNRVITAPTPFTPTVTGTGTAGQSFAYQTDLAGPTILTITYQATVADEASRLVLQNALQARYDALGGASGNFFIDLENTATFGPNDETDTATIRMQGNVVGPCVTNCTGAAFSKTGSGASVNVITDSSGNIVDESGNPAPVDVTYTLNASLANWDGRNPNFTLDRNVVLADTLRLQSTWNTGDANFLTFTSNAGPITALTEVACPAGVAGMTESNAAAAFNGNGYVGNYCVDGQRLLINIGMNTATDVSVAVKAQLNTVDGLALAPAAGGNPAGHSTIQGATRYVLPNDGRIYHRNGAAGTSTNNQYPVKLPDDRTGGLNDTAAFTKEGPAGSVAVSPGDRAVVPYTFTVNTGVAGISATDARIVDRIDATVFDMSDLSQIGVASTYTGAGDVSSRVELSYVNGELIIELGAGAPLAADGTWVVTLQIPTYPLEGKETLDITNYASLFGTGTEPFFWSEDESRATSFGTEVEARKHVYDRGASDWTRVLVAPEDGNGDLIDDVYVYRLQLIAHGAWSAAIVAVTDMLPAEAQFLGFVDAADVGTGGPVLPSNSVPLGHGIVAEFDGGTDSITLRQDSGILSAGSEVSVYFAVQVDRDLPETVVNSFGGGSASIVPGGPSIDIEKWIDEGVSPQYDQRGRLLNDGFTGDHDSAPGKSLTANQSETIRFTISNDGPEPLIDIEVGDQLDSGVGAITGLDCIFPDASTGTTWPGPFAVGTQFECTGTLPALKSGQKHANTAWVTGVGAISGIQVGDADEWHGRVPTQLESTGGQALTGLAVLAGIGILGGGLLMLARRRKTAADS